MPGKKITSGKDFIKEAVEIAYNSRDNWTEAEWNNQIKERFDANRNIYNFRIREVTENSILGATDNYFGLIKMMNQLDRIIENETDPVKKTMAMSVRHVAFPKCEQIIENNTLESIKSFRNEIIQDNDVSAKAIREFDAKIEVSNRATSGSARNALAGVDPNDAHFEDIPSGEQLVVLQTLIGSFMDKNICKEPNGQTRRENQSMKDVLGEINRRAFEIMGDAAGMGRSGIKPLNDAEKADFDALKAQIKGLSAEDKTAYTDGVANFYGLRSYANMDITPKVNSLTLTLDKNPVVQTTAESYVEKQKNGTLSFAEIEWGESNLDYMVEGLYTADELKDLKRAGIDPAMGILVNGNPVNFNSRGTPTMLDSAKKKCEIVSSAMQGAKIDVTKFVPDGRGGYTSGNIVPVKTDLSMNTERRSIWTILKQLFGFIVTLKDKITQANKEVRDYQFDPENAATVSTAKKAAEAAQIRAKLNEKSDFSTSMDLDFYGDVYPTNDPNVNKHDAITEGISRDRTFSNGNLPNNPTGEILKTVGRIPSRVNLAVFYGLSQGHSYEDLTANTPEGRTLRRQVGRDFVEEFKVCKIEEYAQQKNLDPTNEDTIKQYRTFVLDKTQNLETILAKGCEEFVKLPIPKLDPNDHAQFAEDLAKLDGITKLAKDVSQSFENLTKNTLATSDPTAMRISDRTAAVFTYASSQLEPIIKVGMMTDVYTDFIKSDDYINPEGKDIPPFVIDGAAKAKAGLCFFKENSEGVNTIDDLNKNKELSLQVLTLGFVSTMPDPSVTKEIAKNEIKYFIPNENADLKPVIIDPQSKKVDAFGAIFDYQGMYNDVKTTSEEFTMGIDHYTQMLPENQRTLPVSERIAAVKAFQEETAANKAKVMDEIKVHAKEKMSFSELLGDKSHDVITKPKETTHERTLEAGGLTK